MSSGGSRKETGSPVRRPLAQLALAFAAIGICFGLLVSSPDARFAGFALAALCGSVPIVIGPQGLRKYGVLAAAIGAVGIIFFAGSGEASVYRTRARLQAVQAYAKQYCDASAEYRRRTKSWPPGIAALPVPKAPRTVNGVRFAPDGSIEFVLSFPPVKDGRLVFTPVESNAAITWTCSAVGVEAAYLPAACRPGRPEDAAGESK